MGDRRREGAIPLSSLARRELDELVRNSYPELRAVAARALRDERAATLKPTALVHEVYLRLAQLSRIEWQGTAHLLAMAARVAREALVDEARRRGRKKRDGGTRVTLTLEGLNAPATDHDVLDVDDLLARARDHRPDGSTGGGVAGVAASRWGCAVELETSASTVNRKWRAGRTWLVRELAA